MNFKGVIASSLLCGYLAGSIFSGSYREPERYPRFQEAVKYAYMDLNTAPTELHEKILESRSILAFEYVDRWCADSVRCDLIKLEDGKIIFLEELPHFHDIFPADWEEPKVK